MSEIERAVASVAEELAWLEEEPVFVGGATIGLYLDPFGRSVLRPTLDVDCIVPGLRSRGEWWRLEEALRKHLWSPDPRGPSCRYRSPAGVLVDLMPENPEILGFAGRWYPTAVATAEPKGLVTGRVVLAPTPALLLACKLEAWEDRGREDPYASKDIEDIAALLDGCRELESSVRAAAPEVQQAVAAALDDIVSDTTLRSVLFGNLPPTGDRSGQRERVRRLLERLMEA